MRSPRVCFPLVATLALSVALAVTKGAVDLPRGVSPSHAHSWVPDTAGQWTCLDGSKVIPFSAVNDDYCDCKDGSDEPGTSACGTSYFYCENAGHTGTNIRSSRVNDGVCDPECCDGSDEHDGQIECPNVCEEVGAIARKEQEQIKAVRETGSRLRKQYIEYGKTVKAKLQTELKELKSKTHQLEKSSEDAHARLERASEKYEKYVEGTKDEREIARRKQLAPLFKEQKGRLKRTRDSMKRLFRTLENLKENYNKNYHDLAVKSAVSGLDDFVASQGEDWTLAVIVDDTLSDDEEDFKENPDTRLKLLTDDTNIILRDISALYDLLDGLSHEYNKEYNDNAVLAAVRVAEDFRPTWNADRLEFIGELPLIIPEEEDENTPEGERLKEENDSAQEAYDAVKSEETEASERISEIERKLAMDFGPDESFAQLLDECFEYKDFEYTYSICLFGEAHQKSSSTTSLGKFSNWETGTATPYDTQLYTDGEKCWNGPNRSVQLVMSCGETNAIISVSEPAKCEYLFKFQTPALCPVLPSVNAAPSVSALKDGVKKHDEL
ncbi:hypothetical protein EDD11_007474 [Mortierella claussenii]|nr:hypothetical protein EDD11_007474 [Mortierella claussenii]